MHQLIADGGGERRAQQAATRLHERQLELLQAAMAPAAFFDALVGLTAQPKDAVRRRALKLMHARLASVPSDQATHDAGMAAALKLCGVLPALLAEDGSVTAATQQAALAAASALATAYGTAAREDLLGVLALLVAQLGAGGGGGPVRASILAAVGSTVAALKTEALPALPGLVPVVLAAAESVVDRLETVSGSSAEKRVKRARKAADRPEEEATTALGAVGALVEGVGAFLSPYLPAMLALLTRPALLGANAAGEAAFAARRLLPRALAPRLLLPRLYDLWPPALQVLLAH